MGERGVRMFIRLMRIISILLGITTFSLGTLIAFGVFETPSNAWMMYCALGFTLLLGKWEE